MLNSFRSHLSILSKKWYGITTKYRACSGCSAQTNRMKDSTLKDASRSSEYSDAVPVLDEDLNPDSRKDGKQSNKNNLNFYRYKSLIEDHEVSRLDLWTLLKFIKNARHLGHMVPKQISTEDMLNLYIQPSITKRLRLMKYLREREIKLLKKLHPKSSPVYENPLPRPEYTAHVLPQYGLHRNSIMVRIRDLNMSLFYEQRLVANLPFAPKVLQFYQYPSWVVSSHHNEMNFFKLISSVEYSILSWLQVVLDFAYNDLMSEREATKAYLDILELYSYNRQSEQPFNMIFCGIPDCHESKARTQSNGLPNKIYDYLIGNRSVPFPLEYTSRTVTDIFPRDKVSVYRLNIFFFLKLKWNRSVYLYVYSPLYTWSFCAIVIKLRAKLYGGLRGCRAKEPESYFTHRLLY